MLNDNRFSISVSVGRIAVDRIQERIRVEHYSNPGEPEQAAQR